MKLFEIGATGSPAALADYIHAHAKPWLQESKNGVYTVFRGLTTRSLPPYSSDLEGIVEDTTIAFTGRGSKENRRPLDTSAMRHAAFNGMIASIGGVADRSNSIFASGSEAQAAAYGSVFVTIPLGPFHYTWSPIFRDWTTSFTIESIRDCLHLEPKAAATGLNMWDLSKMQDPVPRGVASSFDTKMDIVSNPKNYDTDKVRRLIRVDEGWREASNAHKEVMIRCEKVLYVEPRYYEKHLVTYFI